jgi:hypothetical protein
MLQLAVLLNTAADFDDPDQLLTFVPSVKEKEDHSVPTL